MFLFKKNQTLELEQNLFDEGWFHRFELGQRRPRPVPEGHLIGVALATYGKGRGKRHDVQRSLSATG